jgi:hypothetical protein
MATSSENIRRWIEQSDIDYITNFIKAWIPFNAWYNANYPLLNTDREKISKIKSDVNSVRNAVNALMESNSQEGLEFKNYLALLHYRLQNNHLENRDGKISFNSILKEKNSVNLIDNEEFRQDKYFLKRTDGTRLGEVVKIEIYLKKKTDGSLIFSYSYTAYELEHLQSDNNYKKLSSSRKEQIRLFFISLNPTIITDLIQSEVTENPKNYYKCDSYNFKRDYSNTNCYSISVCKAVLELLYQLRNILFHGELVPNEATQKVYKEAYSLLKIILDKIR